MNENVPLTRRFARLADNMLDQVAAELALRQ
jgi:hypothetical protein